MLRNHTRNGVEKLVPDPFLENWNWAYIWINSLKFYTVCFYCISSWGLSKYIGTKLQTIWFYIEHFLMFLYWWAIPDIEHFLKIKRGLELVSLPHFLHNVRRKMFLLLYSINWSSFWMINQYSDHCLVAFTAWNIGQYMFCNCSLTRSDVTSFVFLIKPFFSTWPKSHNKNLNILRTKRDFKMKWKSFFSFLKGRQWTK